MFDVDSANTMNPDNPSREEMEAKLTALLLGELSEEEARMLRWAISQDPALARLLGQLKRTIGIVREVSVKPAESDSAQGTPLKLSEERRKKLLAHFQTPRPKVKELSWLKRIEIRPLFPVLVILAVLGIVVALSVPNFIKARSTSPANAIVNNLRQLDGAKQEWAMEHHEPADAVPTMDDLKDYLKGDVSKSIAGEKYDIGKVSEPVTADLEAKKAKQIGALPSGGAARFFVGESAMLIGSDAGHGAAAGDVVQLSSASTNILLFSSVWNRSSHSWAS